MLATLRRGSQAVRGDLKFLRRILRSQLSTYRSFIQPCELDLASSYQSFSLYGRGIKYAHRCHAYRTRRLNGCPDGSACTAWDYACLLCNFYRDAGLKHCHHTYTSRAQSPLNPFYTCCWPSCTIPRSQHSPPPPPLKFFHTLPYLPSIFPSFTCTRVRSFFPTTDMQTPPLEVVIST